MAAAAIAAVERLLPPGPAVADVQAGAAAEAEVQRILRRISVERAEGLSAVQLPPDRVATWFGMQHTEQQQQQQQPDHPQDCDAAETPPARAAPERRAPRRTASLQRRRQRVEPAAPKVVTRPADPPPAQISATAKPVNVVRRRVGGEPPQTKPAPKPKVLLSVAPPPAPPAPPTPIVRGQSAALLHTADTDGMTYDGLLDLACALQLDAAPGWGDWDDAAACRGSIERLRRRSPPVHRVPAAAAAAVAVAALAALAAEPPPMPCAADGDITYGELRRALAEYDRQSSTDEWRRDPLYVPLPPQEDQKRQPESPSSPAAAAPSPQPRPAYRRRSSEDQMADDWRAAVQRRERRELQETVDEVNEDLRRLFGFDLITGQVRKCSPGDVPASTAAAEPAVAAVEQEEGEEDDACSAAEGELQTDSDVEAELAVIHRQDRRVQQGEAPCAPQDAQRPSAPKQQQQHRMRRRIAHSALRQAQAAAERPAAAAAATADAARAAAVAAAQRRPRRSMAIVSMVKQ
eukprot:TRINITY_DN2670_c0_g2_i1.p1 TRINITY_DN2670_c0_g2~~TRINITY_DN2670_c0_g2_i1.p1  ORF type:complete len:554 (+),score=207.08 TRINITY_DN2670_c0_g2_i1:107-1663(+)